MRTVPYQTVLDGVLRRRGIDPLGDDVTQDDLRGIVQHINKRIRFAWRIWDWPDLRRTEERAYRTIWSADKQFLLSNADGVPDELIWLDDMTYYRVKANPIISGDPPPGTLPSDTDYFETFTPVDAYISLDQVCRRPIGMVFGIYKGNPRLNGCCSTGYDFRPSDKGIDVLGAGSASVFISYQLPPSKFSAVPYAHGRLYSTGSIVYFSVTGECYIALTDSAGILPSQESVWWRKIPFPEIFAQYVIAGAYADGLREAVFRNVENAAYIQVGQAAAQMAEAEAQALLEAEIDVYMAQGQVVYYNFRNYYSRWPRIGNICVSQPWTGGDVTTLTEICETDPTYFVAPPAPGVKWFYEPAIHHILTASGTPALQTYPVTHLAANSKIIIDVLTAGVYTQQTWRLFSGTADPLDSGQVQSPDPALYWAQVD
jgi:hypothetical protein